VDVPDHRLAWLRDHCQPKKWTPARIEFVDFPGIPAGDEKGKGELMHAIRETAALCLVTRGFTDPSYPHERPAPDPAGDLESLRQELVFGDFAAVEARLARLRTQVQKPTKTQERDRRELALLERLLPVLEEGRPLREVAMSGPERDLIRGFAFASEKPVLEILNIAEADLAQPPPAAGLPCCAPVEAEIAALEPAERAEFLAGYGLAEPFRDRLIRCGYETLGLISFFTIGGDEVKAWTLREGDDALTAAGRIHTDLARGFIRAEVVSWDDLHAAGSMKDAKAAGVVHLEGKEYPVRDGDVINVRFSV
jgi:GTP-binding protein YchF